MLRLDGCRVRYGAAEALDGVALEVNSGEIVALLGPNGAGKTTTLRAVSGLIPLSAGTISWQGRRIDGLSPDSIVRLGIVQVPEGRQIFPELSVEENLRLGSFGRAQRGRVGEELDAMFRRFPPLAERRKQLGANLSGGEQQMLAIARGLMAAPRLFLLDEPSLGLAPRIVRDLFDLIAALRREGLTVLLVEQNARLALAVADRVYLLESGRVVLSGPAAELRDDPAVWRGYLGGSRAE